VVGRLGGWHNGMLGGWVAGWLGGWFARPLDGLMLVIIFTVCRCHLQLSNE